MKTYTLQKGGKTENCIDIRTNISEGDLKEYLNYDVEIIKSEKV